MEDWKIIEEYPNYMVSSEGKVKSIERNDGRGRHKKGKILSPRYNASGYITVDLYKNGKPQTFRVNRLVAQVFIPNPDNKPYVDHINGDKTDNRAENLEWVTSSENQKRRHALGNIKTSHRKIGRFDLNGKLIEEFESIIAAAEKMGVKRNAIDCVLQGRHKTSCGSFWKYLD